MGKFGRMALVALAVAGAMATQPIKAQPHATGPGLPYVLELPAASGRSVYIEQVGSYHRATVVQTAMRAAAQVEQRGARNVAHVDQRGETASAAILQRGDDNAARVTQQGAGQNMLKLAQIGHGNSAVVDQRAVAASGNQVALTQDGGDNQAALAQNGDNNAMSVSQTGAGNQLTWTQDGNYNADLGVQQQGGSAIAIHQTGGAGGK